MAIVELEDAEWQQVVNALVQTNPVLVKIAQQLNKQQALTNPAAGIKLDGEGKEVRHGN